MANRVIIIFPYGGLKEKIEKAIFEALINCSIAVIGGIPTIVVIEHDTVEKLKKNDPAYWQRLNNDARLEIVITWSVDTCQRWLTGWGYVFDNYDNVTDRIVLLPGDIQQIGDLNLDIGKITCSNSNIDIEQEIADPIAQGNFSLGEVTENSLNPKDLANLEEYLNNLSSFFSKISRFIGLDSRAIEDLDIVIGDYVSRTYSAKQLIDLYGTFPLMGNWFQEIFRRITNDITDVNPKEDYGLNKPRSEFLNISKEALRKLLQYTPFAYEQTLNMIIIWYAILQNDKGIYKFNLGQIQDDNQFRRYRDSVDQIERTERMLRYTWRKINEPRRNQFQNNQNYRNAYRDFMREYQEYDRSSTAIREAANIALENFLFE